MVRVRAAITAAWLTLLTSVAHAEPSAAERSAAQTLFDEARRLLERGEIEAACLKFEGSQKLDPGGGTLLNIASCHERTGRLATAWTEFNDGLSWAIRDRRADREKLARQHIASLEPKLAKLTLEPTGPAPSGREILLDGSKVPDAALGINSPIDPGEHTVVVTAPNREAVSETFTIEAAELRVFEIPDLAPQQVVADASAKPEPDPPSEEAAADEDGRRKRRAVQRIAGVSTGGAGVAALALGSYFGVRAITQWNSSNAGCPNGACTAQGVSYAKGAKGAAQAADILIGAGLAGVAVGVTLFLTAPSESAPGVTVSGNALNHGGGLSLSGSW